ncbi:MAG: acyl-CoA dehydrogenase family protein [bacterium]|nr:acyl-CoA dehydrogenase family protein [bacterium]
MVTELMAPRQLELIEKVRHLGKTVIQPNAAQWDRDQTYPWEIITALQEEKLMGVWIPEEYGGLGMGVLDLCIVVEELSRFCGGVGVAFAVNALGSFPILLGGTEEQKKTWLPPIARGEKLISFGLSEKISGSDAGSMITKAIRDGNEYVISGEKKWNTNGGAATIYTIYATTDPTRGHRGVSAFILEKGHPNFEIGYTEDKMGIRTAAVRELYLDQCRVPAERLLGAKEGIGFANAMMTLDRARPGVAAQALGLAQGALDVTAEYLLHHTMDHPKHFLQADDFPLPEDFETVPMASEQAVQFKLAELATKIEAARQLVYTAATAIDKGVKNVSQVSAMCKLFATETAMEVTSECMTMWGVAGIWRENPIEKYYRDAKITQIYEGTNQIQRLVIARNFLRGYGNM